MRAPQIYSTNYDDEVGQTCQLVAYQCKDYESFTRGECGDCGSDGSKCRFVGLSSHYDSSKTPVPKDKEMKFFLKTTDSKPFCQHTWQIKLKTPTDLKTKAAGSVYLNIIGRKRDVKDVKITSPLTGFEGKMVFKLFYNH